MRRLVERCLRLTGTFRVSKSALQRLETRALHVSRLWRHLAQRGSPAVGRRGAVVMLHTGRSGSSVLADMLGQHPAIHWDGELFNYRVAPWRNKPRCRKAEAMGLIERRMDLFDREFYGFEAVSTQLQAGQMDTGDFIASLSDLGIEHFVLLTRRNILRKIVSNLVARERGRWRLRAGEVAPLTQVYLDTDKLQLATTKPLIDHIRATQADYHTLRRSIGSRRYLDLVYEDDVHEDPSRAYRKVCEFLAIEYRENAVRHGQSTPHLLRQVIRNYAEVAAVLDGTDLAWMLEETAGSEESEAGLAGLSGHSSQDAAGISPPRA
jgi:hypothetical protein